MVLPNFRIMIYFVEKKNILLYSRTYVIWEGVSVDWEKYSIQWKRISGSFEHQNITFSIRLLGCVLFYLFIV